MAIPTSSMYAQPNNMTNQTIVAKFLNGFNDPAKIPESLALLAEEYAFKNPMVELSSKAEFIALAQEIGSVLTGVNILQMAQNGDWVAVSYEFTSNLPGLESNLATEWFRLEEGLIQQSHLVYDATHWRKVYANIKG